MPSAKKPAGSKTRRGAKSTATPRARKPTPRRATGTKTETGAGAPTAPTGIATAAKGIRAERAAVRSRRAAGPTITIEQYASGIACPVRQKLTLRALGLRHPRQRVVRPDNPAVRGMVNAIPHLVRIVTEEQRGA